MVPPDSTHCPLQLRHDPGRHVEILEPGGALLWRYTYEPGTPADESPRPYAHPVHGPTGEVLTNFRPNDHPWHHGLSLTLTSVDGVNFWGGPSYRAADGYRHRGDQGAQVHREWIALAPERMEETVEWCGPAGQGALLSERRVLSTALVRNGWSLRWTSTLVNVAGRALVLGNYHALGGLAGSHYTGLQFRGARDLLDAHGDNGIGMRSGGGAQGEAAIQGVPARWLEWSCQHDGTLRRTLIRFETPRDPLPWFVRERNPLVAFAFHSGETLSLPPGDCLVLDHLLTFTTP